MGSRPELLHESVFLGVAGELSAAIDAELVMDIVGKRAAPADESNPAANPDKQALTGIALKHSFSETASSHQEFATLHNYVGGLGHQNECLSILVIF